MEAPPGVPRPPRPANLVCVPPPAAGRLRPAPPAIVNKEHQKKHMNQKLSVCR